jgi:hypothetical protein
MLPLNNLLFDFFGVSLSLFEEFKLCMLKSTTYGHNHLKELATKNVLLGFVHQNNILFIRESPNVCTATNNNNINKRHDISQFNINII